MPKLTAESVKEAIVNLPVKNFSFEDLRNIVHGDYDELKDIMFRLLGEPNPSIAQTFDSSAKAIRFERSRKWSKGPQFSGRSGSAFCAGTTA